MSERRELRNTRSRSQGREPERDTISPDIVINPASSSSNSEPTTAVSMTDSMPAMIPMAQVANPIAELSAWSSFSY